MICSTRPSDDFNLQLILFYRNRFLIIDSRQLLKTHLMSYKQAMCLAAALCLAATASYAQGVDSAITKLTNFPSKFFSRINHETTTFQQRLTRQTERYLKRMARKEEKLRSELYKTDSAKAAALYPQDPKQQYAALMQ